MLRDTFHIELYKDRSGEAPFERWFFNLKDRKAKAAIASRLNRITLGNFGDSKVVGRGIYELRIKLGPGYRVYFGRSGAKTIVLLAGGDKSSQQRDIALAGQYWNDYKGDKP